MRAVLPRPGSPAGSQLSTNRKQEHKSSANRKKDCQLTANKKENLEGGLFFYIFLHRTVHTVQCSVHCTVYTVQYSVVKISKNVA